MNKKLKAMEKETVNFLGHQAPKYSTCLEKRDRAAEMCEQGEISPSAFFKYLQSTDGDLRGGERRAELESLTK